MVTLEYNSLGLDESAAPDFVASVSHHLYGKKVTLKECYASGNFKILTFSNGFYVHISNYTVNEDFEIELSVKQDDYVALHINQVQAGRVFTMTLNNQLVSYDDKIITSLFLTDSTDSFVVRGSSGARVNRLKIMIPRAWLEKRPSYKEDLLQAYFALGKERFFADAMDTTYRSMVDKIMDPEDNDLYASISKNIIELVTERFFNRLNIKMEKNLQAKN